MPDARSHPQPRVRKKQHTSSVTTGTPHQPAFPARWFYGFLRALPGDRAFLPPSLVNSSTNLAPASGRQNHTTSPSATAPLVLQHHRRPSHPAPRFVTIAIRPLGGAGWHRSIAVSTNRKSEKFFEDGLDRTANQCSDVRTVIRGLDPRIHLLRKRTSGRNCAATFYPGFAFNPAASMPAMAQISSLSDVSPETPTAPSSVPPSWIRTPPGTGTRRPCASEFTASTK